jgi:Papain family cysteine protease
MPGVTQHFNVQNMKKNILLLIMGLWGSLSAQTNGLLVADERYQQIPMLPTYSGVKYTEIPARISLKKYCPVPGNQGKSGACVGWAVGYGAMTIQKAIANNVTDQAQITQGALSAAFLYNQIRKNKTDCSEGAYLEDGLALVKDKGDCLEQSFNFDKNDCATQPGLTQLTEASLYRVQDFAAVFALDEDPKSKIGKACKILATQTPLVVGMGVTNSFFEVLPGANTWNPDPTEPIVGHHAMVLVGYNSVEKYFDLLNSFGPSWGQNGFIRVPFDDFERLCRYSYVMVPPASTPLGEASNAPQSTVQPIAEYALSGEFVFRQPAGYISNDNGDELMYFEEIATQQVAMGMGGLYRTQQPRFRVGDVFQLVAREIPRGRYVYVFSQSADGTLNQHFPRKQQTITSAGFVLEKTVEIVIPSEESLLQLPTAGVDYLCIVYSHAPVPQYEQRMLAIEQGSSAFPERVQAAFAEVLIEDKKTQFSGDRMAFSALASPATGRIATVMILGVTAE